MTDRKWTPSAYVDEISPPPRAHPSDWISFLPDGEGGAYALDENEGYADQEMPPIMLTEGQVVGFQWIEVFGTSELLIDADGAFRFDPPPPDAPPGAHMMAWEPGEPDSVMPSPQEFAEAILEQIGPDTATTVQFYAWSDADVPFAFRGGKFEPVDQSAVAGAS
jgi:hypothetical protein